MKKTVLISFIIAMLITLYSSVYARDLSKSEIVHFWIAVPAGNITEPITIRKAGLPPIKMAPLVIDLDQRGILKKILNPNTEAISTHWIYNIGKKPIRIKLELIEANYPIRWEVKAAWPYDPETRTFTKPLPPGMGIPKLSIDWIFEIPNYYMDEKVIYDGGLLVIDADTNELLTFIPIKLIRGGISQGGGASCCG